MQNLRDINLLAAIWLWLVVVVAILSPQASFAYDGQRQTRAAYDSISESATGYGAVSVLPTDETKNEATGNRVPFAKLSKFLAAEGTVAEQGRNALGQFTSKVGGEVAPGSTAVDSFIQNATQNGWSLVDKEVSFNTPFGMRRYDAVLTDTAGQSVSVLGTGAAVGGLWYYGQH